MKPNFLVIGAMKCATTSLFDALGRHPQIFVSDPKEPEFFCKDEIFARGWSWYESMFEAAEGRIAIGEGSTSYTKRMLFPRAAERVAAHLPDAKLLYIVRHPLDRILSHWLHTAVEVRSMPPLAEALERWPHFVDTSLYWKQIDAYRGYFPDDRILILFFEDFVERPTEVMRRCYDFLEVDAELEQLDRFEASHVSAQKRIDGTLLRTLHHVSLARRLKNLAPGVANRFLPMLRKPLPKRPEWPDGLRREVTARVKPDADALLAFCGRTDVWRFD
jgi:hypothetical protein